MQSVVTAGCGPADREGVCIGPESGKVLDREVSRSVCLLGEAGLLLAVSPVAFFPAVI